MSRAMYKTPKGTIDLFDSSFDQMSSIKNYLEDLFKANGGIGLETPVFERRDLLMGKYAESTDTKLVYDIKENGGEDLSLRYDLTVPLTRFIKENKIKKIRRYSIGKVYRRDQPSAGRYREFYQADFDIIGENNSSMLAEAMLLKMACQFLDNFGISNYKIMIGDTDNLKEIIKEVTPDGLSDSDVYFKEVCQSIDKLDKYSFEDLEEEFIKKGITNIDYLKRLIEEDAPITIKSIDKFNRLIKICKAFGFEDRIVWASSLARGLDYYNGFIFEIKCDSINSTIISGGRYDDFIPKLTGIGISFGISRIMTLIDAQQDWKQVFYLSTMSDVTFEQKLEVISKLQNKFNMCYSLDEKDKKLTKVIVECLKNKIRYLIIVGSNEITNNEYILKDLKEGTQTVIPI